MTLPPAGQPCAVWVVKSERVSSLVVVDRTNL